MRGARKQACRRRWQYAGVLLAASLLVLCWSGSQAAAQEQAAENARREVRFLLPELSPEERHSLTFIRWAGGSAETSAAATIEANGKLLVRQSVTCKEHQRLQLTTPRRVSAAVDGQTACRWSQGLEVELHPAARLRGVVEVPAGYPRPASAGIEATTCPESSRGEGRSLGIFPFLMDEKGAWSAPAPAGCLRLRLLAEGFAPVSLEESSIEPGAERDLGRLRLDPGAAVLVRVISGWDRRPVPQVHLVLVAEQSIAAAARAAFSGKEVQGIAGAVTGDGGWARLSGLPRGRFRLLAVPPEGEIPTSSPPLSLEAGQELVLDELELPAAAAVEVVVDLDRVAAPEDAELQVLVYVPSRDGWLAQVTLQAELDPSGAAFFPQVHPGTWGFHLIAGHSQLARQTVELLPADWRQVVLEPEGDLFRGEVTELGSPVEATLVLRHSKGGGTQTDSDPDGRFEVVLKRRGAYDVKVIRQEEGTVDVADVAFEDPDELVRIELPEGALEGVVVDSEGSPVAEASVRARAQRPSGPWPLSSWTTSGPDGGFRLQGLAAGAWQLQASSEDATSDVAYVDLQESEIRSGLQLVLRRSLTLRGRVLVEGQPVAEARIYAVCLWRSPQDLCGGGARTESDGRFEVRFADPPEGAMVNVMVRRPPLPAAAFRRPLTRDEVVLHLPPAGGKLLLTSAPAPWSAWLRVLLLHENGGILALPGLGQPVAEGPEGHFAVVTLPSLLPGRWRLVFLESFELPLAAALASRQALATFTLPAGGALEVPVALPRVEGAD